VNIIIIWFKTEVNRKSKVTLKFGLKFGLKPNSSAKTEFKTELKTEQSSFKPNVAMHLERQSLNLV